MDAPMNDMEHSDQTDSSESNDENEHVNNNQVDESALVVCEDNRYTKPTVVYTGEDAGSKMIECLLNEERQILEILSHIQPMDISKEEREDIISKATYCCICKKAFTLHDRMYNRITMENVRRYKTIEIIHNKKRLDKVTAKPTYKDTTILNEDLVAVELYKSKVNLVKPIFCGMSILDLSKCLMYDFWYNHIKRKYPTSTLLMSDTDSILACYQTEDIYKDMKSSMCHFDTS
ncbi:hypothetical protein MAR_029136, partial [Mya arenaria]